jgi:HK97 family phage major capsid protein
VKTQLIEKRHGLALKARALMNDAQEENRNLTAEESEKFDRIMADVDMIDEQIQRMDKLDGVDLRGSDLKPLEVPPQRVENPSTDYRSAFLQYLRRGKSALNAEEIRALEAGVSAEGGALTYEEFEAMIVEKLQEQNIIRQVATVITTGGDRNIPVEDGEGTATWIGEEGTYVESLDGSSDPEDTFTRKVLEAHKLQYLIKVSEELLQDSSFNLEAYLARMIGRRLGDGEEAAFVAGTGGGKPTGIITSATVGKTTSSATAITADELIDLFHSVKRPYRQNATWLMADSTVKAIRKLKTSTLEDYIWQPGLQAGEPDRLLGRPVFASAAAPEIAADAAVAAFGDMSYYYIADRGNRVLQRLNELYAGNGQIGFRAYERVDGKIVLSEAIKSLKMDDGV